MQFEILYQILFQNSNYVKGKINVKLGEDVKSIKKRIISFQGLKNQSSFKLFNLQESSKINASIKEILIKEINEGPTLLNHKASSRKMSDESMFEETSVIFQNKQQFVEVEPQIPPTVCGYVTICNQFLFCFSSRRYIKLTTQKISFFRSEESEDPIQTISFQQIKEIKSYKRKHYFCIRLLLQNRQLDMRFQNINICKQWVGYLNQNIKFNLFLKQKRQYSTTESFKKYYQTFLNKNMQSTNIVKLQDSQLESKIQKEQEWGQKKTLNKTQIQIIKLSSFKITHKIDSGSFSIVYLAEKINKKGQKKLLALKQLNKDKLLYKNQMKYAITQLNILRRCQTCKYIIPLYYAFQTHDFLYLGLEYVSYGTLASYLKKKKIVKQQTAISIIVELIVVIQYLHANKILYRDLKPQNILLNQDGHIFLTDFGLAKQLNDQEDHATSFLGTPLYLAPQRFNVGDGSIDYKGDIYGIGCIYFELLHGSHPFYAQDYSSVVYNIKNCEPQINENVSVASKRFIEQTLQKNPQKRLNNMRKHQLFKKIDWNKIQKKQQKGIDLQLKEEKSKVQINYNVDQDYNQENFPDKKIIDWNFSYQN